MKKREIQFLLESNNVNIKIEIQKGMKLNVH